MPVGNSVRHRQSQPGAIILGGKKGVPSFAMTSGGIPFPQSWTDRETALAYIVFTTTHPD